MKYIKIFIVIASIMFCTYACKKEESKPSSSPIIVTPAFSAKINGSPYIASSTYCMLLVDSFLQFRAFSIQGYYQSEILSVVFVDSILTEVIDSSTTNGGFGISLQYEDTLSTNEYDMITSNLEFSKFDTISKKTSGTFSGILVGSSPADTLYITEGQFTDIPYIWEHSN
jgi:hypothetical protein